MEPNLGLSALSAWRSHAVRGKIGRQAVDALHVLQTPEFSQIVDALRRPVAHEAATLLLVVEQRHAHAARRLHEVNREAYDLARAGNFVELRNEIGVLRRATQ